MKTNNPKKSLVIFMASPYKNPAMVALIDPLRPPPTSSALNKGRTRLAPPLRAALILLLGQFLVQCYPVAASRGGTMGLASPFDVAAIRAARGVPDDLPFKCKAPPSAVEDLKFTSIYEKDDASHSTVDPELEEKYRKAMRPLSKFETTLAKMANRYVASSPARPDVAACALEWLDFWARDEALLGRVNRVGEFVRKWSLASIASAWLQIRDEPALEPDRRARVERWIEQVAQAVVADYTRNPDSRSRRNNHMIWAAWSVAAAGVALDDRALFDWAMERATNAVDEIVADGTMPLEMDRKSRALLYHTFAAAPLVMLAETGAVNGRNLYGARFGIIHKFVARTLDGLQDPSWFEQVTGVRQVVAESTTPEKIAWLPVYESRFGTRAGAFANPTTEPLFLRRTGGDMALLFGPVR